MKASQIISLAIFVFGTQALVAAPRDARYATNGEVKREAEAAPVAEPQAGICMIGVDSPCNGDAWDENGQDGKTWENHHRFRIGQSEKREAEPAPVDSE